MAKGTGQKLGSLYMELGLDDTSFKKDFDKLRQTYGKTMKMDLGINAAGFVSGTRTAQHAQRGLNDQMLLTNKTMMSQRQLGIQLSNQFGTLFSIYAAERFVRKLAEVTGMFELQHASMKAIIGDAVAADKIFSQIKSLSVESPFRFKDLISYTKQLAAFSVPTNELYETMKNLADVSAGLGVDMGRITLAFGQVKAASVLRGQELRQFTEAGIPLVAELAKKFTELEGTTVSAGEVFERISKRMVSFEMVKDIFDDMTSAGGKFYQMQEIQAATLAGKISNLADAFDIALSDMGGSMESVLKGGVDMLAGLTRHWEDLLKIVISVAAVYGTYKAATILLNAALLKQAATMNSVTLAGAMQKVVLGELKKAWWAVQAAMHAAKLANPFVAITTVVVALAAAVWLLHDSTSAQVRAQERLNELNKESSDLKEKLKGEINGLITIINSETSSIYEQIKAYEKLQKVAPTITGGKTLGEFKSQGTTSQQKSISSYMDVKDIEDTNDQIKKAIQLLKDLEDAKPDSLSKAKEFTGLGTISSFDTVINKLKLMIVGLKGQKGELERIRQEANFLLLPEKTRIDILKQRQQLLLAEKEKLTANKNLVLQATDGFGGWLGALDPFSFELDRINKELEKTSVMLRGVPPAEAPLSAKAKIEAEINRLEGLLEALDMVSGSVADKKLGAGYLASIAKNREKLKAWDLPDKKDVKDIKAAEKLIADNLKARIDLIREAYDEYEKLKTAGYDAAVAAAMVPRAGGAYENVSSLKNGKSVEQAVTGVMNDPKYSADTEALRAVKQEENRILFQANLERLANQKKSWEDTAKAYASYADEMAELAKKTEAGMAWAGTDTEKQSRVMEADKIAADEINKRYAEKSEVFKDTMAAIAEMSIKEMEAEMEFYETTLKHSVKGTEDYGIASAAIEALRKEIAELRAKGGKDTSFKDFKKTVTALNNVQSAVDGLIDSFDDMDEGVKASLTAISATASGTIKILEGISAATAEGISAAEKASVILTVISYAIQIVTAVIKAFNKAEEERKQQAIDAVKSYAEVLDIMRDMNSEMDDMAAKNIFGDFSWDKQIAGIKQMATAAKDYAAMVEKYNKTNAQSNSFGGRISYISKDIKSFNLEAAKIELANTKTTEARRAYLEGLISAYEDYTSAMLKMSDYLSGIFGNVGSSIMDSITENMDSVKDSVDDMTTYVSDALWQMVEDIAYSKYFQSIFGTIQSEVLAAMSDNLPDDATQTADIFSKYMGSLGTATENANAYMSQLAAYLEAAGFNVSALNPASDKSNSLRGNIENIKEDTATKLSGYIAGIAQDSTMGRYNQALIANALTEDGIMIKSEGLMKEVRENIGAMRANSDMMARVMGRFDSCIYSASGGLAVRMG